jgi:hypothetical protein
MQNESVLDKEEKVSPFLVSGIGWKATIKLMGRNTEMAYEDQAMEAATQAVEMFSKIIPRNSEYIEESEKPLLGVYLSVESLPPLPELEFLKETYIALGNAGLYGSAEFAYVSLIDFLYLEAKKDPAMKDELKMLENFYKKTGRKKPRMPRKKS